MRIYIYAYLPPLSSVENVEPEADERRLHKEVIELTMNHRKTRFWVVARLQLRVVEHCSIEISFCIRMGTEICAVKLYLRASMRMS
jgi:hypothetical protein